MEVWEYGSEEINFEILLKHARIKGFRELLIKSVLLK